MYIRLDYVCTHNMHTPSALIDTDTYASIVFTQEDFETWAPAITELAKCKNVVAKLGAIEQWMVAGTVVFPRD